MSDHDLYYQSSIIHDQRNNIQSVTFSHARRLKAPSVTLPQSPRPTDSVHVNTKESSRSSYNIVIQSEEHIEADTDGEEKNMAQSQAGENAKLDNQNLDRNVHVNNIYRARITVALRNWKRRLGWWTFCTLIPGTITIFGVLAWILFLWLNKPTSANSIWRWLIVNDKLVVAVNISSTVLQAIIALQVGVSSRMIAAVAMECYNTLFHRSCSLSILRAYATNPYDIISNWPFLARSWPLIVITLSFTATTLTSPFISTLLVSDLRPSWVRGFPKYGTLPYEILSIMNGSHPPDYSSYAPMSYPTFAEWSSALIPEVRNGIDDTGRVLRAILPISSTSTRESLQTYSGPATILNPRVICMRPNINNLTVSNADNGMVSGYIQPPPEVPDIVNRTQNDHVQFACSIQNCTTHSEWAMSLCEPNGTFTDRIDGQDYFPRASNLSDDWYIIVNYTNFSREVDPKWIWSESLSDEASAWTTFVTLEQSGLKVDITYCLSSFENIEANITASSDTHRTEPSINVTLQRDAPGGPESFFDVSEILRQYNGTSENYTNTERGVMTLLEPPKNYNITSIAITGFYDILRTVWLLQEAPDAGSSTRALCTYGKNQPNALVGLDKVFISAFQSSIQQSKRPARALQALMMLMVMNEYYFLLPEFDDSAPTYNTMFEQHLSASSSQGLIIVGILIALHLLHVILITTLFLTRTKFTMIGEVWSAVSQLYSEDMGRVLEISSASTYEEVKGWVTENGLEKTVVRLQECTECDKESGAGIARIKTVDGYHG